ncbi:MAG: hypothetical protein ABI574_11660 [Burkholderiales bacterium]
MKNIRQILMATAMALASNVALAQGPAGPGPGLGPGQGPGPAASGPGGGAGPHMGPGRAARWGSKDTPGWSLMTQQERDEHRQRMRGMKTYDECKVYRDQHREQMAARAEKSGGKPLMQPRRDACAGLEP